MIFRLGALHWQTTHSRGILVQCGNFLVTLGSNSVIFRSLAAPSFLWVLPQASIQTLCSLQTCCLGRPQPSIPRPVSGWPVVVPELGGSVSQGLPLCVLEWLVLWSSRVTLQPPHPTLWPTGPAVAPSALPQRLCRWGKMQLALCAARGTGQSVGRHLLPSTPPLPLCSEPSWGLLCP